MNWVPRPYMEDAIRFAIERDGCGLMLDPGLGKTSITLAVIDLCGNAGDIHKVLVIAPMRVCMTVWPVEARKWTEFHGLRIVNLSAMEPSEREAAMKGPGDVFLAHPEIVQDKPYTHPRTKIRRMIPGIFNWLTPDFDMLVLDESTKFKDTQSQRFKALRKVIFQFKRRMILTGTPVPNGVQDLFGQMYVVDHGAALGRFVTYFRMEFCYQVPGGHEWRLRPGSDELIYKRVANRLMRLDARDHLDMPVLINNFIEVELPSEYRAEYNKLERAFVAEVNSRQIVVFNASAVGTKLRQMANGFVYDDANGTTARTAIPIHYEKIEALEELVEEMQGRPLLVAYEFQEDAEMIQARFPQAVDIGKSKNVDATVRAFNAGNIPLLIAHPASAGHGLNLQEACSTICWYGITWNLEHYQQLVARVWRQGQRASQVIVHHIVCKDTKDSDVMSALAGKDATQSKFNAAIKRSR